MTYKPRNVGMDRADWAAWARLCKRFPDIRNQVDHFAALMAAQAEGAINVRFEVAKTFGGWVANLTGYSPVLVGCYQNFRINQDPSYPNRFDSITEATEAAVKESGELRSALERASV